MSTVPSHQCSLAIKIILMRLYVLESSGVVAVVVVAVVISCAHTGMHRTNTGKHAWMHACIHTYIHAHMHTHMHTYTHACKHAFICILTEMTRFEFNGIYAINWCSYC